MIRCRERGGDGNAGFLWFSDAQWARIGPRLPDGYARHKRAGVMLLDLVEAGQAQVSLFDTQDPRDDKLIEAFDAINDRLGPGAIQFGPAAKLRPGDRAAPSARPSTPPVGKTSRRSRPEHRRPGRRSGHRPTSVKITQKARSLRQILTRRRENEVGDFRAAGRGRENAFAALPGDLV